MIILLKGPKYSGKTHFCREVDKALGRHRHFKCFDDVLECNLPVVLQAIRVGHYPVYVISSTPENIDRWAEAFRKVTNTPVFVWSSERWDK